MNLLKIEDLNVKQVMEIFDKADDLKNNVKGTELSGKTAVLFFPESSIRTRITFEKAVADLGGRSILFQPSTIDKREELKDVIKYIGNWANFVIIRHSDFSKVSQLAKYSEIPIINAMTSENHPCEILSDLYSLSKIRNNYRDLTYTFVGEKGNISRSWAEIAKVMNLKFNHVCICGNEIKENDDNYSFHVELEDILSQSDIILTDPLSSELRTKEYIQKYQITLDRMKKTKKNSLLNPCPPFFRSEEVSTDVIESTYFVGYKFKENLLCVQQAIILYCLEHEDDD
ncbi:MAG: ornithine carbamoyltransferase [Anaerosolibacter sp.]|jgi:ornithine carbamoyltransferase|uniref:ornithine carbamoyltransferase n=1 Tax=Anaerosolibacter sp. TaxID=1872527 RepID=UPI00262C5ADB|nr:peptide transporter [Anaerosolibacter sp.]MDF2547131.1 ornithine carbamoyltransferase [Anaerosolibacter sp.]